MFTTRRSLRAATAAITVTALLSGLPVADARIVGIVSAGPSCSLRLDDSSRAVFDRFVQDVNQKNWTAVNKTLSAVTGSDVALYNKVIEFQKAALYGTGGNTTAAEKAELAKQLMARGATAKEADLILTGGLGMRDATYNQVVDNSQPPALSDPAQLKKGPKELADSLTWDSSALDKVLANPFATAQEAGPHAKLAYEEASRGVAASAAALKEVYTLDAYKQALKDCADKLPDTSGTGAVVVPPTPNKPTTPGDNNQGTTPGDNQNTPGGTSATSAGSSGSTFVGLGVLVAIGVAIARLMPFLQNSGLLDRLPQLPQLPLR